MSIKYIVSPFKKKKKVSMNFRILPQISREFPGGAEQTGSMLARLFPFNSLVAVSKEFLSQLI